MFCPDFQRLIGHALEVKCEVVVDKFKFCSSFRGPNLNDASSMAKLKIVTLLVEDGIVEPKPITASHLLDKKLISRELRFVLPE